MTLEEAKIADEILEYLINKTEINKEFKYLELIDFLFNKFNDKDIYTFVDLFVADNLINLQQKEFLERSKIGFSYSIYVISPRLSSFLKFNGGYYQKVKNEKSEKKKSKIKFWFDIVKDLVLIILSILAILLSS